MLDNWSITGTAITRTKKKYRRVRTLAARMSSI